MRFIKIILFGLLIYYLYIGIQWIQGYYSTPQIIYYQVNSHSKEEWRLYDNRPGDTFYIKYYTFVIDGYKDFKQYHEALDVHFCDLIPDNLLKYQSFGVSYYIRSNYTKEDMNYGSFNRHNLEYSIADYGCSINIEDTSISCGKTYFEDYDAFKNLPRENIKCQKIGLLK